MQVFATVDAIAMLAMSVMKTTWMATVLRGAIGRLLQSVLVASHQHRAHNVERRGREKKIQISLSAVWQLRNHNSNVAAFVGSESK